MNQLTTCEVSYRPSFFSILPIVIAAEIDFSYTWHFDLQVRENFIKFELYSSLK